MKRKTAVESFRFPFLINNQSQVSNTLTLRRKTCNMSSEEGCWETGLPAGDWIPLVSLGITMFCLAVLELYWFLNSPECSEITTAHDSSGNFMGKNPLQEWPIVFGLSWWLSGKIGFPHSSVGKESSAMQDTWV